MSADTKGDDVIVGIDLGTTNSLVGAVVDGRVRLFPDAGGAELLPSVVSADGQGGVLVGRAAKNRRLVEPAETVASVKRSMGTDRRFRLSGRDLGPAEVSALILGALADRAEKALGARPARAVITVPAFFDDTQREATRDAGDLAGLRVERLVNEPTAAAMTYQTGAEELVLVYDLGGGTFDVSILERDEGLLEVRTSRGDTHLGGDDLDAALTQLLLSRFGAKRAVVERDPRAMTRLVEAVERAKIALSDRTEVRMFDPFLAGEGASAVHLDLLVTRAEVEDVARPFIVRTLRCIDEALRDARVTGRDLQRVLLVGGASKMPIVARLVAEHLGREAHVDADADRAVALGAALLAGRLGGAAIDEILVDITPHTLGAGVIDASVMMDAPLGFDEDDDAEDDDLSDIAEDDLAASAIIPRDTVVPVERTRTYSTMYDDQPAVEFPITQGEARLVGDNTRLGSLVVSGLPPSPQGSPIEVTFRLDLSGVLHVAAKHVPSGKVAQVTIANSPARLTDQRRREARAVVEHLRAKAQTAANDVALASPGPSEADLSLAKAMIARAEKALATPRASEPEPGAVERANTALGLARAALAEGDARLVDRVDALSDALLDLT